MPLRDHCNLLIKRGLPEVDHRRNCEEKDRAGNSYLFPAPNIRSIFFMSRKSRSGFVANGVNSYLR